MSGGKSAGMSAGTRSSGRPMNGPPGMFNNPLFNSAPQQQAMPQYVAQPSSEGAPKADPFVNFRSNMGLPSAPAQPFNPYQAVPDWARPQQGAFNDNASPNSPAPNMPTPQQLTTRFSNMPGGK